MKPTISFSDFSRLDVRVGTVDEASLIEGTDNLLRLDIDLGDEGKRQLVAGIAQTHDPVELKGRNIVVIVNLEEKKIRGVVSQGMLLAAESGGEPVLIAPERKVEPGSKIR